MAKKVDELTHLERIIGQAIGEERALGLDSDPAKQNLPHLWEWLTSIYVGKDFIKQPAVVSIAMGPEGPLVRLNDVDLATMLETKCDHLANVLEHLEAVLALPSPPFRNYGKKQPTLRKRKRIS